MSEASVLKNYLFIDPFMEDIFVGWLKNDYNLASAYEK